MSDNGLFYLGIIFGIIIFFIGLSMMITLSYVDEICQQNTTFSGQTMTHVMDDFCKERMRDGNARASSFNPHYTSVALNCMIEKNGWTKYNSYNIEDFCMYASGRGLKC